MVEFMRATSNGHSEDGGAEIADRLRPVEEAHAVPRPPEVKKFWVEYETEKGAEQQRKLYEERGEIEAAGAARTDAGLEHQADGAEAASSRKAALAEEESQGYQKALRVLGHHDHRRTDAVKVYWLRWLLFVLGDAAGAGGAILLLGEMPFNAMAQAASVAVSAVTLGGVGRQVRYWVAAGERQKPAEELSDEETAYASWFSGPDKATTAIKILALICIAGLAAVVGGIYTLRGVAEGQEAAVAFGCFALGLGLASAYNSYDVSDQVAEHLDAREARVSRFEDESKKVRGESSIAERARARAERDTAKRIAAAAGEAAALEQYRRMYRTIGSNPGIAGHGTPPATEVDAADAEEDRE